MGRHERFDPLVQARARRAFRKLARDYPRRAPRRRTFGLAVALLAGLTFGIVFAAPEIAAPGASPPAAEPTTGSPTARFSICGAAARIDCVVDGDTFWIGGEKVRIAGIDTPELHPARCAEEERRGEAAKQRLRELLNGGEVTLHRADAPDRDRYGRLLRNASVGGRDVGAALIAESLARPYGGGRRSWC